MFVYVQFKQVIQSFSLPKINQLINVKLRTCDRKGKELFQRKNEKSWFFDEARNALIEKQ